MGRILLEKWLDEQIAYEEMRIDLTGRFALAHEKEGDAHHAEMRRDENRDAIILRLAYRRVKDRLARSPDAVRPIIQHVRPYDPKRRY
jgi:hypothetical protein